MGRKTYVKSNSDSMTINAVFVYLIAAFMLIIPFYRGLFFRVNYIPSVVFVSIVFAAFTAYKLKSGTYKVLDTYMDIAVILIPAAYFISFFFAANAKDAFDMFLLYCSYFMLYKLVSYLSHKNEKYKDIFINVVIVSTFLLSFTAMLNVAGLVDINGVFVGKRLYGLYQYANTTASVLGVGIILSLNKLINEENIKKTVVYQVILTALISSFIFTLSRGGYLVLAGVLSLNFLLIKARAKFKMLMSLFVSFFSSSMFIYKFYIIAEEYISGIWIHYLISLIVSAVVIYMIYLLKNRIRLNVSDKSINAALIITLLVVSLISGLLFSIKEPVEYRIEHTATEEKSWKYKAINLYELKPDSEYTIEFNVRSSLETQYSYGIRAWSYSKDDERTDILTHFDSIGSEFENKSYNFSTLTNTERVLILLYNYETDSFTEYHNVVIKDNDGNIVKKIEKLKYVPELVANRLADISLETENVSFRMYYNNDGLKIIKDYPLAGAGGGAWKNLYRQYQLISYNTTEVHNFFVQYSTEVGIIGLAVLVGLLILLIISMIKSIKVSSNYLYVYLAAMLLLFHSTIDFNLSLAAVGYVLWMLIGVINSDKSTPIIRSDQNIYIRALSLGLAAIVFVMSYSIYYGMKLGAQGARASQNNVSADKIIKLYERASTFDRYNGAYRIDLAQVLNNQLRKTKDKKYLDEIEEQISLIKKYEPYNHQYTPIICSLYFSEGKFEEASTMADNKLQDEPLLAQSYMIKIDVNYQIADYYLRDQKVQEAVPYLERVREANEEYKATNAKLKTPLKLTEDYPKKIESAQKALELIKAKIK